MQPTTRNRKRGFTLVELLVVIVILSILSALAARAVFSSINMAKEAAIKMEMTGLMQKLSMYEQEFGAYPPSSSADAVAYIKIVAPILVDDDVAAAAEVAAFDEDGKALVFWLQGISRAPASPILGGGTRDYVYDFNNDQYDAGNLLYKPSDDAITTPYVYTRNSDHKVTISHVGIDDDPGGDNISVSN